MHSIKSYKDAVDRNLIYREQSHYHMMRSIVNFRLCFSVTILCVLCFLFYKKIICLPKFTYTHKVETYKGKPFSRQPKVILLYDPFFGSSTWDLPGDTINETYFRTKSCPESNCIITNNRNYFSSVSDFDALLFHTAERLPVSKLFLSMRTPEQLYVFVNLESPAHTRHDFSDEIDFYNLTMTYRFDADIFWPYGYIQDVETGALVAPKKDVAWRKPIFEFQMDAKAEKQIAGKNKMAAWFVSNCGTISKRDDLVKVLQQYIKVDVYGKCGTLRCPRDSNECSERLDHDYKFYLAFENSLCIDYVTEKLFNTLDRNIVPVVFGGADYSRYAPPHSYINVENFKSVVDLAVYLKYLDENPAEYRKYFWWKKYYKQTHLPKFCNLCERLNNPSNRERTQYYKNIKEWWYGHTCRTTNLSFV